MKTKILTDFQICISVPLMIVSLLKKKKKKKKKNKKAPSEMSVKEIRF